MAWLGGYQPLKFMAYMSAACPTCFMLLMHWTLIADDRARDMAGIRIEIRTPMMPITTNNSTRVKAAETLFMACTSTKILERKVFLAMFSPVVPDQLYRSFPRVTTRRGLPSTIGRRSQ